VTTWAPDELAAIAGSEELQITTQRPDGTPGRTTTIWVVRVGDDLYVRSGYGANNTWYRRATARPAAHIHVPGLDRDVNLAPADPALTAKIDAAYRAKYHRYGPAILNPMTSTDAAAATLRLLPRTPEQS
jgi:hypothetical protein